MDAIVTAGGIPRPEDPLYTYSHGDSKALIDVAGKPMIQWVLEGLEQAVFLRPEHEPTRQERARD